MARSAPLFLVCVALLVSAPLGSAHYLGLTDTAIEVARPGVRIVQTIPFAELAELDGSGTAEPGGTRNAYLQTVNAGWRIADASAECRPAGASVRQLTALEALQFELRFHCDKVVSMLEIDYELAAQFEPSHINPARVFLGGRQLPWRFSRERRLLRLPVEAMLARSHLTLPEAFRSDDPNADLAASEPASPRPETSQDGPMRHKPEALRAIAATYLPSGVEHILLGPDHVAFVLALVLVPLALGRLILAVTVFTLAHSLTLALSYFQILSLPPTVTEPLIALSVAAVGVENLLAHGRPALLRLREATVFCFGLVHGVGLSYQLGELPSQSPQEAAARLLMFNLGVELGQLAILLFPGLGLLWAVRQRSGRRVTAVGSAALIGLGCYWFFSRLFFS